MAIDPLEPGTDHGRDDVTMSETRSCFLHGDYTGKDRCPGCIHAIPPPMAFRDAFEAMATVAGDDEALAKLEPSRDSRAEVIEKAARALADLLENDEFQVAVGGNPNAVANMLARAREALALLRREAGKE